MGTTQQVLALKSRIRQSIGLAEDNERIGNYAEAQSEWLHVHGMAYALNEWLLGNI